VFGGLPLLGNLARPPGPPSSVEDDTPTFWRARIPGLTGFPPWEKGGESFLPMVGTKEWSPESPIFLDGLFPLVPGKIPLACRRWLSPSGDKRTASFPGAAFSLAKVYFSFPPPTVSASTCFRGTSVFPGLFVPAGTLLPLLSYSSKRFFFSHSAFASWFPFFFHVMARRPIWSTVDGLFKF